MEFDKKFREAIDNINNRISSDPSLADSMKEYWGKILELRIANDAQYLFRITEKSIIYDAKSFNQKNSAEYDMLIKMDIEIAKRIINERSFSISDIPFINTQNVSLYDIGFFKEIFTEK